MRLILYLFKATYLPHLMKFTTLYEAVRGPPPGLVFAIWSNVFAELSVYMSLNELVADTPTTINTTDR
jgi:hypothetical protein